MQIASPLLMLAGTLLLLVGLRGQVRAALAAWAAAHVLTAGLALVLTRDTWLPFRLPRLDRNARALVRLALAMGASQVIALIAYRCELFVLELIDGVDAVGVYSVANQAAESMWLIGAAIATAITATVVRDDAAAAAALIRRSVFKTLLYTAVVAGVVAVAAPFVVTLALGDAFAGAEAALLLLLPGMVAYAPVQVMVVYLSVRCGRPRLSLASAGVAMAVTLTASVPLILAYGARGAAAASSIGYGCGALIAWALFRRVASRIGST